MPTLFGLSLLFRSQPPYTRHTVHRAVTVDDHPRKILSEEGGHERGEPAGELEPQALGGVVGAVAVLEVDDVGGAAYQPCHEGNDVSVPVRDMRLAAAAAGRRRQRVLT